MSTSSCGVNPDRGLFADAANTNGVLAHSMAAAPCSCSAGVGGSALIAMSITPDRRAFFPPRLPRPDTIATSTSGRDLWKASPSARISCIELPVPPILIVSATTVAGRATHIRTMAETMTSRIGPPFLGCPLRLQRNADHFLHGGFAQKYLGEPILQHRLHAFA